MKTFVACILAAIITSSNGLLFSLLGGGLKSSPQEYLHHHHHHHEVLHTSVPLQQHSLAAANYASRPVDLLPQYVQVYKVIHEKVPVPAHPVPLQYGAPHGWAHPPPVFTKVLQPIVNKNFIQSRHEHHYHQIPHGGPVPVANIHHQKW